MATVDEFLARYGAALENGDLDAIADCYAYPSIVIAAQQSIAVRSRDDVRTAFDGAAQGYAARGLVRALPQPEAREDIGGLAQVDVRWSYRDAQNVEHDSSAFRYLLRESGDWRICAVIPIDT